jgi:hypothetical protein
VTLARPKAIPNCVPVPPAGTTAAPTVDLPPLPDGVRWLTDTTANGARTWTAAVPASLPDMQASVLRSWVDAGWKELFGEAEPGREAEGRFERNGSTVSVRVRNDYCDTTWSQVDLSVRA